MSQCTFQSRPRAHLAAGAGEGAPVRHGALAFAPGTTAFVRKPGRACNLRADFFWCGGAITRCRSGNGPRSSSDLPFPMCSWLHIVNTRGARILTGIDINYPYEIANLWVTPWTRFCQILLVLLVWGHFVVGLHFWLRIRGWYRRAFPVVLLFYVLVRGGALLGFTEVGMEATHHVQSDPAWFKKMKTLGVPADPHRATVRAWLKEWIGVSWLGLVGLVFLAVQARHWQQRGRRFRVSYPGNFSVTAHPGMSILEVSRMARRPHVSVCGGRARCTPCRIRIEKRRRHCPRLTNWKRTRSPASARRPDAVSPASFDRRPIFPSLPCSTRG